MEDEPEPRAGKSDEQYFAHIYRMYYAQIYRFLFARLRNTDSVSDIIQDVFMKAYKGIVLKRNDETILPYLYTITRNTLIDHYRKHKDLFMHYEDIEQVDGGLRADTYTLDSEMSARVSDALLSISEEQRTVITLIYMKEMSISEVAGVIGKSEEAVRQIKSRGQRQLRGILEKYEKS